MEFLNRLRTFFRRARRPASINLLQQYQQECAKGIIRFDPEQLEAIRILQQFIEDAGGAYKGVYLWGSVGRGKTYVMDLFFQAVSLPKKKRLHAHAFMAKVHKALALQKHNQNPMQALIMDWATECQLLCLDEFEVTTIADAMLMRRLFEGLHQQGVKVVMTSNTPPEQLYKNGLQREHFLPFIDMVLKTYHVVPLLADLDYRRTSSSLLPVFLNPSNAEAQARMEEFWTRESKGITQLQGTLALSATRYLVVERLTQDACWVSFQTLCGQAYGPADYLKLCNQVKTLFLHGIPVLGSEKQNELLRFIHLVDVLYDTKTKLIATADQPPELLYSLAYGREKFTRTISRLYEMQEWVEQL